MGVLALSKPIFSEALDLAHSDLSYTILVFATLFEVGSFCRFVMPPLGGSPP
jgi:hypothetical protein